MAKNLNDWLAYIEHKYVPGIDLGLDRVSKVAKPLQITEFKYPVIAVAGTNGKGSCIACLEAIFLAADLQVGTYTSPHLLRFNERIKINGHEIDDDSLCEAFAVVDETCKDVHLTYFEFTTIAALYIFQQFSLDFLLLEVGLGGRLDAVNIVDPDIAVITTISLDHTDYLGGDREAIGREKAGIMRERVPIVCGDLSPPLSVSKHAQELDAPYYAINKQFHYDEHDSVWEWHTDQLQLQDLPIPNLPLQNAATALMVIHLLQLPIDVKAIKTGLKAAFIPGRFQHFAKPVTTILDVAHNPESAEYLARKLEAEPCTGRTLAVVGMLQDKDIVSTLKPLISQIDAWYLADLTGSRAAKAQSLQEILAKLEQKSCYTYESVLSAYEHAVKDCAPEDRIIVFGSFYTVGDVLKKLKGGNGKAD